MCIRDSSLCEQNFQIIIIVIKPKLEKIMNGLRKLSLMAVSYTHLMVKLAERLLRRNPSQVTILSPLVTYLFTFVAGTGHVAYSCLLYTSNSEFVISRMYLFFL